MAQPQPDSPPPAANSAFSAPGQALPAVAGEVGVLFASEELWHELAGPDAGVRYLVVVAPSAAGAADPGVSPAPETGAEDDRQRLLAALAAHRWRREETAAALGVSRTTLWRRMRQAGLTG